MLRAQKCIKAGKTWQVMQCDEDDEYYAESLLVVEMMLMRNKLTSRMQELGASVSAGRSRQGHARLLIRRDPLPGD